MTVLHNANINDGKHALGVGVGEILNLSGK